MSDFQLAIGAMVLVFVLFVAAVCYMIKKSGE